MCLCRTLGIRGWSKRMADVSPKFQELSIEDGVVVKGERIVVPSSLRQCMMDKVNASLLGVQWSLMRSKEAFYWPGIYRQMVESVADPDLKLKRGSRPPSRAPPLDPPLRGYFKVQHLQEPQTRVVERTTGLSRNAHITMAKHLSRPIRAERHQLLAYNRSLLLFLRVGYTDVYDSQSDC